MLWALHTWITVYFTCLIRESVTLLQTAAQLPGFSLFAVASSTFYYWFLFLLITYKTLKFMVWVLNISPIFIPVRPCLHFEHLGQWHLFVSVSQPKTNGDRAVERRAPRLWNSLPEGENTVELVAYFTSKLKMNFWHSALPDFIWFYLFYLIILMLCFVCLLLYKCVCMLSMWSFIVFLLLLYK